MDEENVTEVVFLGVNDVGWRVYEWLCSRDSVEVRALITTKAQLELVEEIEPELVVAVGYSHIVPPEILDIPEKGCVNLHPGLLPYNRGSSPNVWSIVEGTPAGATLHYMDEEIDSGDVIAQKKVRTRFDDNGRDLHERLEEVQFELFVEAWDDFEEGSVEATSQNEDNATYHTVEDFKELCRLQPDERYTVKELLDVLRALTFPPFDNAYVEIDDERYYVEIDITSEGEDGEGDAEGLLSPY